MMRTLIAAVFVGFCFGAVGGQALTPKEAEKAMKAPDGFNVTLCVGEPDIVQPVAFEFDDRGRLWVAEFKSYPKWAATGSDRILIFEDLDGKGHYGKPKVFWDKGNYLSGFTFGFGGVWVCCAPNLYFFKLNDEGDAPVGEPEVVLNGWGTGGVHNVVNSLTWGPDGWLYGCSGITGPGRVGKPGTPDAERVALNAGVWRYHPTKKIFEAVLHGTTNPWGIDFDDVGQMFITNNVIGHLWHVVPGMHTKRMFGDDINPNSYGLIEQCADHIHWAGGSWQSSRGGKGAHNSTGGGHSHTGAMIYAGDNWPASHRNSIFMLNTHGNRINNDILKRRGSGYVATHGADILFANDELFRGTTIKSGPDGAVYFADWNQGGECHSGDLKSTGRIYRMAFGEPKAYDGGDLDVLDDADVVKLLGHKNDWFVRRARRLLQERANVGLLEDKTAPVLQKMFDAATDTPSKLRALWALNAINVTPEEFLLKQLDAPEEEMRAWAVRMLGDFGTPTQPVLNKFAKLAKSDPSQLVRLYLASVLRKFPADLNGPRNAIVRELLAHSEDANDHNLPLMYWYAYEPMIGANPVRGPLMGLRGKIPLVREYAARRATELNPSNGLDMLQFALEDAEKVKDVPAQFAALETAQVDVLNGMLSAFKGRRDVKPPFSWKAVATKLNASTNAQVRKLGVKLAVIFGDVPALDKFRAVATDAAAPIKDRELAIETLVSARDTKGSEVLRGLLNDSAVRGAAIRGLAVFDDPQTGGDILTVYPKLNLAEKSDAFYTLGSRGDYARALLIALRAGRVPKEDMNAFTLRYLENANVPELNQWIKENWGGVNQTPAEKLALIAKYKKVVQSAGPQAMDVKRGQEVFKKTCINCHTLFGEGGKVGPDLTGSGRGNLDYLLTNIVDPNALVQYDFQVTAVRLKDGRMVSGLKRNVRDTTFEMITANELVTLTKSEVAMEKRIELSMMPEGILETLSEAELLDLIAYLQSDGKK